MGFVLTVGAVVFFVVGLMGAIGVAIDRGADQ